MTSQQPPIDDADLHAYVDDQLPPERRVLVQAHLDADPDARARVQRYRELNLMLVRHYGAGGEPVHPAQPAHSRPRPRRRGLAIAAAASLAGLCSGMLGGGALGYRLASAAAPSIESDLVAPAAFAHAVYAPEQRHPVEVTADQESHLVAWLSNRLHRDVRPPDLSGSGYQLIGGRLLPSTDRMAAQFMYQSDDGRRVTLYLRAGAWGGGQQPFRHSARDQVNVLYWTDGTVGYALSGAVEQAELSRIADLAFPPKPGYPHGPV